MNGRLLKKVNQFDTYYDYSDHELTKKNIHLRIRKEYNDRMNFLRAEFSYKGSPTGDLIEIRPDTSIQFVSKDEVNKLETILNRLGYLKLVLFNKKRERWKLEGIELEIDKEITGDDGDSCIELGSFCQASLETENNVIKEDTEKLLWKILFKLGYKTKDYEKKSYIELFFLKKNL